MASYLRKTMKFQLPYTTFQEDLAPFLDSKTVVISVFGPSSAGTKSCKVGLVDEFMGHQVFKPSVCTEPPDVDPSTLSHIEGCYSSEKNVLFLHLIGMYDTSTLVKQLEKIKGKIKEKGFMYVWSHLKHSYTGALLFLFHISHILIMNHPAPRIDITCLQLFQAVNTIRLEILPAVQEILSQITGVSSFWATSGRFCIPRVLWFFENCPPEFQKGIAKKPGLDTRTQDHRKVEHEFQDNIHSLFHKSGVTSDAKQSSLFLFPRNMEFVCMVFEENPNQDSLAHFLINSMIDSSQKPVTGPDQLICFGYERFKDPSKATTGERFEAFLQQHINKAFTPSGFGDGTSQHANMMNPTETPALGVLLEAANALYTLIVRDNQAAASAMSHLREFMNVDARFSDAICTKAMPLALNTYLRDLPAYYGEEEHLTRVELAVKVFKENARGPFLESYLTKFEADLRRYWLSGRQLRNVLRRPPALEGGRPQLSPHPQDPRAEMDGPVRGTRVRRGKQNQAPPNQGLPAPHHPPVPEERDYQWLGEIPRNRPMSHMRSTSSGDCGSRNAELDFPSHIPFGPDLLPARPSASAPTLQGLATAFQDLDIADTSASGTLLEKKKKKRAQQNQAPPSHGLPGASCPPVLEERDYQSLGAIPRNYGIGHMRSTGSGDFRSDLLDFPPLPPPSIPTLRPNRQSASAPTLQGDNATAFQDLDIAEATASGGSSATNATSYKPQKYQRRKKPED